MRSRARIRCVRFLLVLAAAAVLTGACAPPSEPPNAEPPQTEPHHAEPPSAEPSHAGRGGGPQGPGGGDEPAPAAVGEAAQGPIASRLPSAASGEPPLVVFLGDSLTAGLGVAEAEAFPEQVRRRLAASGVEVRVTNAGVSGDTTAGGLARLDWLLRLQPDVLVVGLGANDGLRGLALAETEANLRAIVEEARRRGARVLLLGMLLPPNYGPDYTEGFRRIYPTLAAELEVPLVPFLLAGVAGRPELNQADGIHPTAAGHRRMADNVAPALGELLESAR